MTMKTMPINVRLPKETIDHLKRVARYESCERDEDLSYADLIREAVERTYPMPKRDDGNEEDEA